MRNREDKNEVLFNIRKELGARGIVYNTTNKYNVLTLPKEDGSMLKLKIYTSDIGRKDWVLHATTNDMDSSDSCYYMFVECEGNEPRVYHIVPGVAVVHYANDRHVEWTKGRSLSGKFRKDTDMRKFFDLDDLYAEKWSYIK